MLQLQSIAKHYAVSRIIWRGYSKRIEYRAQINLSVFTSEFWRASKELHFKHFWYDKHGRNTDHWYRGLNLLLFRFSITVDSF